MSETTFAAEKKRLDLPPKFSGKPTELFNWLFKVEQYYDIVGIVKPVDKGRLAVPRLESDAFTSWYQLTNCDNEYKLGELV